MKSWSGCCLWLQFSENLTGAGSATCKGALASGLLGRDC